ncbi:sensor histidine kinase [Microbacterium sp. 18062]|uniref:sensor histidine kinase n=1 Tax=Microbacterium sp. 18062 TaxID=2681410 RepID=UPI00135820E3|nr:histidine kinase [Microbacterium sp. 18062]
MTATAQTPLRPRPVWERVPRALALTSLGVIAVALVVNTVTLAVSGSPPLAYVCIVLSATGVAAGLRHPYAGLIPVAAAAPMAVVASVPSTGIWSIACFFVFLIALRGSSALIAGGVVAVSNLAAAGWEAAAIDANVAVSASVAAFAAVMGAAIGSAIRDNASYRREVEQRAHEAELTHATAVERGVAQERLRIARDLHDSVGHQVAVVNMRLGAAEVHLPPGADAARADLVAARAAAQAVLRETQQILSVLRVGDDPARSEHAYHSVAELVERWRDAGMQIEDTIAEPPPDISPQAAAAVFRIVQESLTNAQKHGEGTVSLTVERTEDEIRIQVVNMRSRQTADPQSTGGNGLVGMRERAESAGGGLDVRIDGRLFWLDAVVPVSAARGR